MVLPVRRNAESSGRVSRGLPTRDVIHDVARSPTHGYQESSGSGRALIPRSRLTPAKLRGSFARTTRHCRALDSAGRQRVVDSLVQVHRTSLSPGSGPYVLITAGARGVQVAFMDAGIGAGGVATQKRAVGLRSPSQTGGSRSITLGS